MLDSLVISSGTKLTKLYSSIYDERVRVTPPGVEPRHARAARAHQCRDCRVEPSVSTVHGILQFMCKQRRIWVQKTVGAEFPGVSHFACREANRAVGVPTPPNDAPLHLGAFLFEQIHFGEHVYVRQLQL